VKEVSCNREQMTQEAPRKPEGDDMNRNRPVAQLHEIRPAELDDISGDLSARLKLKHLTWAFLANGMTDHVLESEWIRDEDHVYTWIARLGHGDTVHGRLPYGYDEWVVLALVDHPVDEAKLLGRER
jgi:hypothetical protein